MQRSRFFVSTLLGGVLALAPSLRAQQSVDQAAVRGRIASEIACTEGAKADLTQWSRLLADARRQLESGTTPLAREDAAHSIVVLEGRIRDTAEALLACVAATADEAIVVEEAPTPEPVLAALAVHLRAGTPTPSGRGRVEASAVHRALLGFGREVDVCYEALAGRHAIVNGTAELVLHVLADGTLVRTEIRGLAIGDAIFVRCVESGRARIVSPGRPTGGEVAISVPLHFGPEG